MSKSRLTKDTFVTVAIPYNGNENKLIKNVDLLHEYLSAKFEYYEILITCVNDIRKINDEVESRLLINSNTRIIVLSYSSDFGVEYTAILDNSLGDYVIIWDINKYDSNIINKFINLIGNDNDIVLVDLFPSFKYVTLGKIMYKLMNYLFIKIFSVKFRYRETLTAILTREAINRILAMRGISKILIYSDVFAGLIIKTIKYPRIKSSRKKYESIYKMIKYGIEIIVSNSRSPLRLATLIGLCASFLSLLFLIYVLVISIFKKQIIEGWVTTSIVNGSLFLFIFFILTLLSEYVSMTLSESKNNPFYFITKDMRSTTADKSLKKVNVIKK